MEAQSSSSATQHVEGGSPVEGEQYLVEAIWDKKPDPNGTWMYLVKWVGWPVEANTWEPLKHLHGCSVLLNEFEAGWKKKHGSKATHSVSSKRKSDAVDGPHPKKKAKYNKKLGEALKRPVAPNIDVSDESSSNYDSDETPSTSKEKEKAFVEYDVLHVWPEGRIPTRMLSVVSLQGSLTYLIEWQAESRVKINGNTDVEPETEASLERSLVKGNEFQLKFPQIVIKYYEGRTTFLPSSTPNDVLAGRAARALLNARSRIVQGDEDEENTDNETDQGDKLNNLDSSSDSTLSEDGYEIDDLGDK